MKTAPPQRVLLVISCYSGVSTGQGGHYYTVRDLALAFKTAWPPTSVEILIIGDIYPLPFKDDRLSVTHVDFTKKSLRSFIAETLSFGDSFSPTHVHSFDNKSHFFGRWIGHRNQAKVYLTRPGGPNSKAFFPYASDIICFSEENMRHLQRRRNLRKSRFHFLPQRVAVPPQDKKRIAALRELVGDRTIILRVCRISNYYIKSINQTLMLTRSLREQGVDASALIIGVVQDGVALDEVCTAKAATDYVITDPYFTVNASQLISLADAVVGTGRSLVEAALLRKVLLTPLADSNLPVLVTNANWRKLAETNFSERNELDDDAPSLRSVVDAIRSADDGGAIAVASEMSLESAIPRYLSMYQAPQEPRPRPLDFALNSGAMLVRYCKTKALAARPQIDLAGRVGTSGFSSSRGMPLSNNDGVHEASPTRITEP
ncbi:hypothetical protein ACNUDN_07560 [Mycobacterium sp. smrl_JER01]|uniref:hypothetical protein n=1 Tax=Mycobacterium sp. smrl_JER01 TaxID=3402633 RepID=UPI003ACF2987